MNRKAVLLVAMVFVLGLVLGGLSTYLAASRVRSDHSARRDSSRLVAELTEELNLTADQQQQLGKILDETWARYQTIYEQYRSQRDEARQQGRQKIRAILTAEQLPKFEARLQRIDEARKKRNGR